MMLSRTGRDRASLWIAARLVGACRHHGVEWRVRPTGGPHLLLHRHMRIANTIHGQCLLGPEQRT